MDENLKDQELSGSVNDIENAAAEVAEEASQEAARTVEIVSETVNEPIDGMPPPVETIEAPEIEPLPGKNVDSIPVSLI